MSASLTKFSMSNEVVLAAIAAETVRLRCGSILTRRVLLRSGMPQRIWLAPVAGIVVLVG